MKTSGLFCCRYGEPGSPASPLLLYTLNIDVGLSSYSDQHVGLGGRDKRGGGGMLGVSVASDKQMDAGLTSPVSCSSSSEHSEFPQEFK